MAYVAGEWLDTEKRLKRIELLKTRLRKYAEIIKRGQAYGHHYETLQADKEELLRLRRIHRAETDVAYFFYEYLSDLSNPDNDDNIIQTTPDGIPPDPMEKMAPIHREFFDLCDHIDHIRPDDRLAIGAARGHNKSGTFSNGFPLHQLVFRKRRFILIVSETDDLSKKLMVWINKQLKFNERLREDFGELLHPKQSMNEKDNEERFITSTGAVVEASSSGKRLRGARHGSVRPDLVIIDDPSSMHNENTKEARDKLIHWFNTEVTPIGARGTAIVLVGTMVSASGLLNHVLKRRDFRASLHSAVVSFPEREDLWNEYCEIYAREEDTFIESERFYRENEAEMLRGVEVAWPWRWTYRALMHEKTNMPTTRAFYSEYLNRATSEDEQIFFPEKYAYYTYAAEDGKTYVRYEGRLYDVAKMTISGFWDIAMGKNARSCYNAVVTVGKFEEEGLMFVLDEFSSKETPNEYINLIVRCVQQFGHDTFAVETINAQHEFYRQLQVALRKAGLSRTRVVDVKSHKSSKEQRIESLEPLMHNKTLILNERHTTLLDQMRDYPNGDYVDSLDALQGATDQVYKRKARVIEKPNFLYA